MVGRALTPWGLSGIVCIVVAMVKGDVDMKVKWLPGNVWY